MMTKSVGFSEDHQPSQKQDNVKICWLGISGAGKTTILNRVTMGVYQPAIYRTLGIDIEQVNLDGFQLICWDTGGQDVFREMLWKKYILGSHGIIYVVDSADFWSFKETRGEFWHYVIENPNCKGVPILILANKQDLPMAVPVGMVAQKLGLHLVRDHSYAIMPVSAKTGFNIDESLTWLRQRIEQRRIEKER